MKNFKPGLVLGLLLFMSVSTAKGQETNPADITIDRDGYILKGKFYKASGDSDLPTVILLQGSPGNTTDVLGLGNMICRYGINAMTFNYSGTHQSEGKLSFPNCLDDVTAVRKFLNDPANVRQFMIDTSMIVLAGYSFGGGVGMTYVIRHPEVKRFISIAGNDWGQWFEDYIENPQMKKSTDAGIQRSIDAGIMRFAPGCTPWELGEAGIEKLDPDLFLRKNAAKLADRNLLLIGGWDDNGASLEGYIIPLYRALKNEGAKSVQIIAFQDDHSFGKSRDKLAQAIVDWVKQTVFPAEASR